MFSAATKTAAQAGGYKISRSLRFKYTSSQYLNRTPGSATNRKTWTWSGWVKRGLLNTSNVPQNLFGARNGGGSPYTLFRYDDPSTQGYGLLFQDDGGAILRTTPQYRDCSAWYHIVLAVDTTQATASNRVRIYVNNVEVTSFSTATYPTQNADTTVNSTYEHRLGAQPSYGDYYDGYMTETYLIDGQQLTPSSFGKTDAQTGVWGPKAYSGSYGTNGFYLNFSDNSNTTAATLGKDYSGNGNNWTPNNFSVAAGANNSSLVDTPTNYGTDTGAGGTVRGNYCTLNPINTNLSFVSLSNGNLDYTSTGGGLSISTFGLSTGKWYWEHQIGATNYCVIGMYQSGSLSMSYLGASGVSLAFTNGGSIVQSGVSAPTGSISSFTSSDIIGFAYDADAGTLTVYKNNVSALVYTGLTGTWFPAEGANASASGTFNFGQRPFAYTAPSGYKALVTQNLPTPTVGATTATQAGKYFNPVTYTGTGAGGQSITGVGFAPDFVWIKNRALVASHALFDQLRGVQQCLSSNSTAAESTQASMLTAFGSDGFTTGGDAWTGGNNAYVAWNWKANGSGVSNTAGSITSTVSANTTSGFSVVTYTGNAAAGATVGHGLGVAPSMIICKTRTGSSIGAWQTYHASLGATKAMFLNLTDAAYTNIAYWNNTAPTSSVFSLGGNTDGNGNGYTMVAYCFAAVPGYSAFGSYTGNGSSDGPFVYTGFRPAFLILKDVTTGGTGYNWTIWDAARNTYNIEDKYLLANASDAEAVTGCVDFLSNGFKIRLAGGSLNQSGDTIIYMAFAQNPFKYSLAR